MPTVRVRRAEPRDQAVLGRFGADLMRRHHDADPHRFISSRHPEEGYGWFLTSQLDEPDALVMVAEPASSPPEATGEIVGYVFATLEGTSWMDLRGPCGIIHDVYVEESARRNGTGAALLRAAIDWIHSRERKQVVLWTKSGNDAARHLFERLGFRLTMHEMTLDGDPK